MLAKRCSLASSLTFAASPPTAGSVARMHWGKFTPPTRPSVWTSGSSFCIPPSVMPIVLVIFADARVSALTAKSA